jgi:hypothetical protein
MLFLSRLIKPDNGHIYLAIVIDAYSKKIVEYRLNNKIKHNYLHNDIKRLLKTKNTSIKNSFIIQTKDFNIEIINISNLIK